MNLVAETADIKNTDDTDPLLFSILTLSTILVGISLTHLYSYLLFHTLSEFFSIVVAGCVFVMTWNGRYVIRNNYLMVIGIAYLFIGGIDLVHTLTYSGMGIIKGYGNNLPTQLWIAARYMESISLMFASVMINRRMNVNYVMAVYIVVTALIFLSIFKFNIFPDCYLDDTGLTLFKKISEFIISLFLLTSLFLLITKKQAFDGKIHNLLVAVILATITSELVFAFYTDVYGISNLTGHLFKIVSFYLLYKAIIETSFRKPYAVLLRDLHQRETDNLLTRKRLEAMVAGQKAILENLNEGLLIADPQGNLTDINYAGHTMLEMEKTKTIGRHRSMFFDIFEVKNPAGESISPEERPMAKILNHEKFNDYELQMHHKLTGKSWFASFSGTPVYNEDGEFILGVLVMRDITDKKLAERELKYSHDVLEKKAYQQAIELENERKRFYFVLEHLPAFICLIGPDYSLPYVNQYFKTRFGDPKGKHCYHMKHRAKDVCEFCPISTVLETNTPEEWDWFDTPDKRIYHMYAYPFKDIDGTQMILEMGVDITQRIKNENKLKLYSKELELRNQELQEFAYVASHDLQEPLRKIQTFGSRIREKYFDKLDEKGQDYLLRMENAATRMRALITALLDYSRISIRGEDFQTIDLNQLISETLIDLEDLIHRKKARLEIDALPSVEADPNQMRQLFQNLISNGIKFNTSPAPLIRIRGMVLNTGDIPEVPMANPPWCRIFIEDNGIGFDEKYAESIFKPFQRLHGNHAYKGTGIGLAICRKVVERHNGRITVKSTPDSGSTFIMTLPMKHTGEI